MLRYFIILFFLEIVKACHFKILPNQRPLVYNEIKSYSSLESCKFDCKQITNCNGIITNKNTGMCKLVSNFEQNMGVSDYNVLVKVCNEMMNDGNSTGYSLFVHKKNVWKPEDTKNLIIEIVIYTCCIIMAWKIGYYIPKLFISKSHKYLPLKNEILF